MEWLEEKLQTIAVTIVALELGWLKQDNGT